ncbi:MAG TPA: DUF1848 domain-containing protein [Clostridiales bacterium]|nr:DUF1848 domain-containing protein [Clostridiales bacterium]
MILSASRRTDIPCYYSEWFMNRIRAGYVLTRNPMNHAQLSRIPLSPDVVDCIVFWTKDAANMLSHLDELDERGYKYYFQFTLTPYGRDIERNLCLKSKIEDTFVVLSKRIGRERVVWRYDPIILNITLNIEYHKAQFVRMCDKLSSYTDTVTISFVDMYSKLKTNLIRPITEDEIAELAEFIGKTAKEHGIRAVACCEKYDLTKYGIGQSSCIDRERIEKVCGYLLDVNADKNQRDCCGCAESIDIGAYNTCPNGCVYCYANDRSSTTLRRHESHSPESEMLIGTVANGEKITDRKVKTNRTIEQENRI